jgi:hypothetical protein
MRPRQFLQRPAETVVDWIPSQRLKNKHLRRRGQLRKINAARAPCEPSCWHQCESVA